MTEIWLNDHLVLDTTKPFSERGYLDLERAALTGRSPATCGGRWLNEDVIDVLYSVVVRGWDGPPIKDGVDHATIPASRNFLTYQPGIRTRPLRIPGCRWVMTDCAPSPPFDYRCVRQRQSRSRTSTSSWLSPALVRADPPG